MIREDDHNFTIVHPYTRATKVADESDQDACAEQPARTKKKVIKNRPLPGRRFRQLFPPRQ